MIPPGCRFISLRNRYGKVRARALVDAKDYVWACEYRWYLTNERYARRSLPNGRKSYLHREIMGLALDDRRFVDHINRNRLNCRRANMRIVNRAQQQQNLSAQKQSLSQYRGVFQRRESGRWVAQVTVSGIRHTLGTFDSEREAAQVAADFRRQHMPFSHETLPPRKPRDPLLSFRHGSSKYRGVAWSRNANKWMAYGAIGGRRTHLGYFVNELEAAHAAAAWRDRIGRG